MPSSYPGLPLDWIDDCALAPLLAPGDADALVSECAIVRGDPYFFTRLVERVSIEYRRWQGHGVPEHAQWACAAMRLLSRECSEAHVELAWARAFPGDAS